MKMILTTLFILMAVGMVALWVVNSIREEEAEATGKPFKSMLSHPLLPSAYLVFVLVGLFTVGIWES
jgi:hypothetical protein